MKIDELKLSVRTHNTLIRAGITTVDQVKCMPDDELKRVRGLSAKCLEEVRKSVYCVDCERSVYGKYKNCDVNIENNGKYAGSLNKKCYCRVEKQEGK